MLLVLKFKTFCRGSDSNPTQVRLPPGFTSLQSDVHSMKETVNNHSETLQELQQHAKNLLCTYMFRSLGQLQQRVAALKSDPKDSRNLSAEQVHYSHYI